MISVESRDERKRIGVEFGVEKEMEDIELEEGEAFYYHNGDDSTIDPDVALSYIDEKLQDVLGHFQKDFEGGVSAENLGAKFGGYGSFLPSYPRSPAWSHPRTPPEVYDYNIPRSPNNQDLEASRHNSVASSGSSLAMRPGAGSTAAAMSHASRTPSVHDQVKRDVCVPFTRAKGSTMKGELVQKSKNPYAQKTLKVRIKVGSDNLPTTRNSEIYNGLGLDVSPSSSLEGSFTDSEGLSRDFRDAPDESPTSILKKMTSFLLHGALLSPLSDDLILYPEKEKNSEESVFKFLHKAGVNGYDSRKGNWKLLSEKKPNAYEKNAFLESSNCNAGVLLEKETDIDSLACEELVSNALKLPLLYNTHSTVSDSAKGAGAAVDLPRAPNKGFVRDKSPSNVAEEEFLEPQSVHEIGRIQKFNGNVGLSGNISKSKKASYVDNSLGYPKKKGSHKGKRNNVPTKAESKRGEVLDAEIINPVKAKIVQGRTSSNEYDTNESLGEEQLCMVSGKKLKEGQTRGVQNVEVLKDGSANDYLSYERNKSSHANSLLSKSDSEDTRKDHRKAGDKYQEFFGDLELGQEDIEVASKQMSSMEKLKDSELVLKGSMLECNTISKEIFNRRKTEKPSKAEEYYRVSSNEKALFAVSGLNSDANPTTAAPLVKEDWVQCDKCEAWRLLPLGTNPKSLPQKWVCSMLNWLPALNRCGVSEEETTQALRALYQAPASGLALAAPPETQSKQNDHPGKNLSGVSSGGVYNCVHNHHMLGRQALSTGGKKKYKSKDISNRPIGDGPTQFPNSVKKKHKVSAKSKSLNGVNCSPSIDERGYQNFGQSSGSLADKLENKQTQKKNLLENYSAAGDAKSLKMRSKGQSDIDSSRASKKVKTEDAHYNDGNCIFDQGGATLKAGHCLGSKMPNSAPRKDRHKSNSRSKDSKSDIPNNLSVTEITLEDGVLPVRKSDSKSSLKKRKGHGDQDTRTYNEHIPSVGHFSLESCDDQRKEKKARISRSEGKNMLTSKAKGGIDKRARETKDQPMAQDRGSSLSQRSLDAADSLKRDAGSLHPSVAATSSSSKVSGSCKNKTIFQEVKGSPVESVSSSPLRVSSTGKFASIGRNPRCKDNLWDGRFLATSSPRRFSDGEDDRGSDRSGTLARNVTHNVNHHGSIESSVVDLQDRDLGFVLSGKIEEENRSSPDFATHQPITHDTQYALKTQLSEQYPDEERRKDDQSSNSGSHFKKLGNGSSSHSKDVNWSSKSEYAKVKIKVSDSMNESLDDTPSRDGKSKFQEKSGVDSQKVEKNSAAKELSEISKGENHSKFGGNNGSDNKLNAIANQDAKQNVVLDTDVGKTSKKLLPDKADGGEVSGRGRSHSLPPSARYKNDKGARLQPISGCHKENGAYAPRSNVHDDDTSRAPKQSKIGEKQNENPPVSSRHHTPTMHKVRDHDGPPLRKDSSSHAATNAIKEAKDLKHLADRLKHVRSNERMGMYFQAALKFLYGASLLESCNNESSKHNEIQSMDVYSSTAKLCEFCAREYERSQDMAAAALAYKCMEVAYMRVIYLSHTNASRDRNELQTALQIVPPGESPSSSASDVDNLNNPATLDKVSSNKGVDSPQVAGNHVITARNRSSFMRLLNLAQDVSCAMEAARKAQATFAAANSRLGEAHCRDGISSVKVALNFNFQDVEGLLRLVRIAMDTISR